MMRITTRQCRDLMNRALETPLRLDCGPDVLRSRQRFYRVRARFQAQGDFRFDVLRFHVDGGVLIINKYPLRAMYHLRRKLRLLQELRSIAADIGIDVGGHADGDDRKP